MPMGNMKLRRRRYRVGISGVANVSSRHTKSAGQEHGGQRPQRMTPTEVQPTIGPMLSTSMAAVTAPARLQLPTQSMPSQALLGAGGRAGSTRRPGGPGAAPAAGAPPPGRRRPAAPADPRTGSRHPKYWITGEPSVTPEDRSAGADQRPPAQGLDPLLAVEELQDQGHRGGAGGRALHAIEGAGEEQHADVGRGGRERWR